MMHGMKLQIFADHQNLTFNTFNLCEKRWCLLIEEFDYDV